MKILWITNILFPEAMERIASGKNPLRSSGGWMLASAEALISGNQHSLVVATVSKLVKKLTKVSGEKIEYYVIPYGKGNEKINKEYDYYWKVVNKEVCPDIVHIHGTEFSHGYSFINACGSHNVVVSIQGILSACSKYYTYGISRSDIYMNLTLRDLFRGSILRDKRRFNKRSKYEKKLLSEVNHVIGRTTWDKVQVLSINSNLNYHFCNEVLRPEFYIGEKWNYADCLPHSIFLSQAGYPIKGLHQLLKALPLILKQFPDTIVRVAGPDITKCDDLKDIFHYSGYASYIKHLIRKNNLEDRVKFVGGLTAEEIKHEYLNANVFLCPSSIENSPNSLCEAQILGVPCIASYVGGIPDFMIGYEENLYRYEEVEMLADRVCNVFHRKDIQRQSVNEAHNRHDINTNISQLLYIYSQVIYKDEY